MKVSRIIGIAFIHFVFNYLMISQVSMGNYIIGKTLRATALSPAWREGKSPIASKTV